MEESQRPFSCSIFFFLFFISFLVSFLFVSMKDAMSFVVVILFLSTSVAFYYLDGFTYFSSVVPCPFSFSFSFSFDFFSSNETKEEISQIVDLVEDQQLSMWSSIYYFLLSIEWRELLFYVVIFHLLFYLAAKVNKTIANMFYKEKLFINGFLVMIFSRDFKWKKPAEPSLLRDVKEKTTRRIVFIRHGESEWNEIFNRGFGPKFFYRLLRGIFREIFLLTTRDSVFVDASLSEEGMEQAENLHHFLTKPQQESSAAHGELIAILRGEKNVENSVLVCSNLRRAIATAALAFQDRITKTKEQILLLSSLQEISRNVDANALAKPREIPDLHVIEDRMFASYDPTAVFNASFNDGQKKLSSNGMKRMLAFCSWCFSQPKDLVIVGGGHSFYFRAFFRSFLDAEKHHAKDYILNNAAVVSFELECAQVNGELRYRISPDSLVEIFTGDEKNKSAFKLPK
jgi:broad specificity phosphatase PhoE